MLVRQTTGIKNKYPKIANKQVDRKQVSNNRIQPSGIYRHHKYPMAYTPIKTSKQGIKSFPTNVRNEN